MHGLVIDNFAGGGGASTGIEQAIGRPVDVAINHDEAAIAVHKANHPHTKHYCQSIYSVDPMDAAQSMPVMLVWFSPDCTHHSKAKGGQPREKNIRDMAHVVPYWIERLSKAGSVSKPKVIMLENVEEFRNWGPLDEKGMPIKSRKGEEFDLWVRRIRKNGYKVEWRELKACDYGAPTTRKRLFLYARCDGLPIVWPEPTHGAPDSQGVLSGKLLLWRTAAECIDWSIPCPSIFDRKRPLKDTTCRRIAAGMMKYVVNAAKPFIVPVTHTKGGNTAQSADEPLRTITTAKGGEFAVASPTFVPVTHQGSSDRVYGPHQPLPTVTAANRGEIAVSAASLVKMRNNSAGEDPAAPLGTVTASGKHHAVSSATLIMMGYGEREGQKPRVPGLEAPMNTVVAGGVKSAVVAAHLVRQFGKSIGAAVDAPMPTIVATGGGKTQKIAAFIAQHNTERGDRVNPGQPADKPLATITGRGTQQQPVQITMVEAGSLPDALLERAELTAAFLVKYYGSERGQHQAADVPLGTATTKGQFAVITVTIESATFILVDIGMRMLTPRELANAQGLPADYVLDPECHYITAGGNRKFGRLPKSYQIDKIGNSVCPAMSKALVGAMLETLKSEKDAA